MNTTQNIIEARANLIESKMVDYSEIHWFENDNISRSNEPWFGMEDAKNPEQSYYDDFFGKVGHMLAETQGFDPTAGGQIAVELMSKEEQEKAVKELQSQLEKWEKRALAQKNEADFVETSVPIAGARHTVDWSTFVRSFKNLRCTKDGKIITPKYKAIYGFRRGAGMVAAMYLTMSDPKLLRDTNLVFSTEIPITVYDFKFEGGDYVRTMMHLRENSAKRTGVKEVTLRSMIREAWELYCQGASESQLMHALCPDKRGMAQKLHRICQVNQRYPKGKVIDKILNGTYDPKPVHKESIYNLFLKNEEKAPLEKVSHYFTQPQNYSPKGEIKTGNEKKMMDKESIRSITQRPVNIVAQVADAIISNDSTYLNVYNKYASLINPVVEAVTQQDPNDPLWTHIQQGIKEREALEEEEEAPEAEPAPKATKTTKKKAAKK